MNTTHRKIDSHQSVPESKFSRGYVANGMNIPLSSQQNLNLNCTPAAI